MANQYWILSSFKLITLEYLLNPGSLTIFLLCFSVQSSSAQLFQFQRKVSPVANEMAQSCTKVQVEQYIALFRDPWQQETAVHQLITTCGQTAIPALTRVLQTEPDTRVREMAVIASGHIGGTEATKALIATLKNDSDSTVRKTAADALGYIRNTTAINPLIIILRSPKESIVVRQAAAEALGLIGGNTAISQLVAILKDTCELLDLRQAAAKALGQIGEPAIDTLEIALQDPDLRTQYWAVKTLTEINFPRSINVLKTKEAKITQILEAAYKVGIVEFDRIPAGRASDGSSRQLARKPIICKNKWIARHWARCL